MKVSNDDDESVLAKSKEWLGLEIVDFSSTDNIINRFLKLMGLVSTLEISSFFNIA